MELKRVSFNSPFCDLPVCFDIIRKTANVKIKLFEIWMRRDGITKSNSSSCTPYVPYFSRYMPMHIHYGFGMEKSSSGSFLGSLLVALK